MSDQSGRPRQTATVPSVLELFTVGIGPSSSHTVGPMRAATAFLERAGDAVDRVTRVRVTLCGSLGATGLGHGSPDAVVAGLRGLDPASCDPALIRGGWTALGEGAEVSLLGRIPVRVSQGDIRLAPLTRMPLHSNGMRFEAFDETDTLLLGAEWYSVGGGTVRTAEELEQHRLGDVVDEEADGRVVQPYPFANAVDLLEHCSTSGLDIAELTRLNEIAGMGQGALDEGLDRVWRVMSECVDRGLDARGVLPGGLGVRRRASALRAEIDDIERAGGDAAFEWLQAFAMAVSEENAAGGRVVTAPTNGAAGIIPSVARHHLRTARGDTKDITTQVRRYLLTAGAIGTLYRRNASISGAEAGCQGEVGSACSMAAGAYCALLGGTPQQVTNAAEIAMEHHLGLTCDPVAGLVQVPCIERNAVAAVTAVSAARLALRGDGTHLVSLDTVIETMRQTGADMSERYKETAQGGLAVNVVEC
jgi:L-serine dehydratase